MRQYVTTFFFFSSSLAMLMLLACQTGAVAESCEPALTEPATIDTGAVVAFVGGCPKNGWQQYKFANGRFIVGAGPAVNPLTTRKPGAKGGSEMVQLTLTQMPRHDHGLVVGGVRSQKAGMNEGPAYHNSGYVENRQTAGGNSPHENMPPFLALDYCVKM